MLYFIHALTLKHNLSYLTSCPWWSPCQHGPLCRLWLLMSAPLLSLKSLGKGKNYVSTKSIKIKGIWVQNSSIFRNQSCLVCRYGKVTKLAHFPNSFSIDSPWLSESDVFQTHVKFKSCKIHGIVWHVVAYEQLKVFDWKEVFKSKRKLCDLLKLTLYFEVIILQHSLKLTFFLQDMRVVAKGKGRRGSLFVESSWRPTVVSRGNKGIKCAQPLK